MEEEDLITQNPLLNSLIISHINSYLSYSDRKSCRLVCQAWNDEITKSLRKVTRVRIDARGAKQLDNLVNLPPPSDANLFSDFYFGPGVHLEEEDNQPLTKFFEVYGPNVRSLSINNCICSTEDLKVILYQGCPNLESLRFIAVITGRLFPVEGEPGQNEQQQAANDNANPPTFPKQPLPNLKSLGVNVRSSDLVRNTDFMVDLLSVAPNVETISWIKLAHDEVSYDRNFQLDLEFAWSAPRSSNGLTIRDTIYDVAIHHTPLNITKLSKIDSNMRLSNSSVMALHSRQFPLQYLDITLVRDVCVSPLTALLESLSGTLKSLKLEFYPSFSDGWTPTRYPNLSAPPSDYRISHGNFHFPKMDKLEHCYLKHYAGSFLFLSEWKSLSTFTCCDLDVRDYLQQMYLDMNRRGDDRALSSSLELFQVFWDENAVSHHGMNFAVEDISMMSRAFPNLSIVRGVKGISPKRRRVWNRRFEKLKVLEELASENNIGGLKATNKSYENGEYCYCCAHKKLQRVFGPGALAYWS